MKEDKNINITAEQFKSNLSNVINNSELPPSFTYYIIKDVFHSYENSYFGLINSIQLQEYNQEQEKQVKEETS